MCSSSVTQRLFHVESIDYFDIVIELTSYISTMIEFKTPLELYKYFVKDVTTAKPPVILEIGAREAMFSKHCSLALPKSKVFAFEASPHNYRVYSEACKSFDIQYLNYAVGAGDGVAEFFINSVIDGEPVPPDTGRNSLLPRTGSAIAESIPVQIITIDHFLAEKGLRGQPLAVWIDVEGATGDVLRGMVSCMKDVDSLFVEVEEKRFWANQWLRDDVEAYLNFHGLIAVARDFEFADDGQYNMMFKRNP